MPPTTTRVAVPLEGPWAGALARTTSGTRRKRAERLVAVADDRRHLEAIALAAGALLLARGEAPPGACRPGAVAAAYLADLPREWAWRSPAWAGPTEAVAAFAGLRAACRPEALRCPFGGWLLRSPAP